MADLVTPDFKKKKKKAKAKTKILLSEGD